MESIKRTMVQCLGGQELHEAIAENDVALVRKLFPSVMTDVESAICDRVKSLPDGNQKLSTAKELGAAIASLVASNKAKAGAPRTKGEFGILVVTPSAPRAASICGTIARSAGTTVAKLFGRHMSMEEQAAFVAANIVDVAVGTPHRIAQLADRGAIELKALRWILVDSTPDEKDQTFFTSDTRRGERRPDGDALVALLRSAPFKAAFSLPPKRAPGLVCCLLPPRKALEASTPVGQRMITKARGRGDSGKGGGGGGAGRRRHGAIEKYKRPKLSAFASKAFKK